MGEGMCGPVSVVEHLWRSENDSVELVLSSDLYGVQGWSIGSQAFSTNSLSIEPCLWPLCCILNGKENLLLYISMFNCNLYRIRKIICARS